MPTDTFTIQQRHAFYNALLHLDPENKYVFADKKNDTLSYNTNRIIVRYKPVSGSPTDKELTRALIILHLLKDYGYNSRRITIENEASRKYAEETDIYILNKKKDIEILCKMTGIREFDRMPDSVMENRLFTLFENKKKYSTIKYLLYLSVDIPLRKDDFPVKCIGIDTTLSQTYDRWESGGKLAHFFDLVPADLPPQINNVYVKSGSNRKQINNNIRDLNANFGMKRINTAWNKLREFIWGGSLEDNKKFENFNKVLLAKIYDEKETKTGFPYTFQRKQKAGRPQSDEELAHDIDLLYRKAYRDYLIEDTSMELLQIKGIDYGEFPVHLVGKCVDELQSISLCQNPYKNLDIMGEFYEKVIREAFKQTKGLFLTHPNIALFIISALEIDELIITDLRKSNGIPQNRMPYIIDPSCGTGTFLALCIQFIQKTIDFFFKHQSEDGEDPDIITNKNISERDLFKRIKEHMYGIEIDPVLATACRINMILHGGGTSNIFNADGLNCFLKYRKTNDTGTANILSSDNPDSSVFYSKNTLNKFDVIISNPPYSVNVTRTGTFENFEMTGKSEVYFLERWYQLLKPGGRIGVVLPESFFAVADEIGGRLFLYRHFNVKAIVSLPDHAFRPYTTTSTSLLFATKKTTDEEILFNTFWRKYTTEFTAKLKKITQTLTEHIKKDSFNTKQKQKDNNFGDILKNIEQLLSENFGKGFTVLPYFGNKNLHDKNYMNKIKHRITDIILKEKDRWILYKVSQKQKNTFYNFSVDEIGYKAGKKGSKDKPNDLITLQGKNNNAIYNLKYSRTWHHINTQDKKTVLGIMKELKLWQ